MLSIGGKNNYEAVHTLYTVRNAEECIYNINTKVTKLGCTERASSKCVYLVSCIVKSNIIETELEKHNTMLK